MTDFTRFENITLAAHNEQVLADLDAFAESEFTEPERYWPGWCEPARSAPVSEPSPACAVDRPRRTYTPSSTGIEIAWSASAGPAPAHTTPAPEEEAA